MGHRTKISLDNPVFRGRIRQPRRTFVRARPHAPIGGAHRRPVSKPEQTKTDVVVQEQSPITSIAQHAKHLYNPKQLPHLPRQSRSSVLKRQTVKPIPKKYHPKHRRPVIFTVASAMAVALFGVGLLAVFSNLRSDKTVKAQTGQAVAGANTDEGISNGLPSEKEPPLNINDYVVADDLPRFLNIEKLGVKARVRRLGIGTNNVIKSPSNIFDVGWYEGSAKPGENGTVVVDGHASGATKHGVFYSLSSLKSGDKLSLERGDGKIYAYTIVALQTYDNDKVDMDKVMKTSVPGKSALNLVSCSGRFNVRTNQFEQRVAVFAIQDQ
jgi:LPXTG-site transpeptidase (sortase) family protein